MEDVNSSTVWALYKATVLAARLLSDSYVCLQVSPATVQAVSILGLDVCMG